MFPAYNISKFVILLRISLYFLIVLINELVLCQDIEKKKLQAFNFVTGKFKNIRNCLSYEFIDWPYCLASSLAFSFAFFHPLSEDLMLL